jgi:hypothetical protein
MAQTTSTGPIPQVLPYANFPVLYQMPHQGFHGMMPISLPGLHVPVIANTAVNLTGESTQGEAEKGKKKSTPTQLDGAPPFVEDTTPTQVDGALSLVDKHPTGQGIECPPSGEVDNGQQWGNLTMRGYSLRCRVRQLDGPHDSSSEDEEEEESDEDDVDTEENVAKDDDDEEPLCSDDDDKDDDGEEGINDIVICQFDRVTRSNKTKWKFVLKNGVIKIRNRDYVFQKVTGEADW